MEQLDDKILSRLNKRIEEGRVSREISKELLLEGNPSQERMYGRLEAYLQTGVVIDPEDLKSVVNQYDFTPEQLKNLALLSKVGLEEGLIQEPDNMRHYGCRLGCFAVLSEKYISRGNSKC